MTDTTLIQRIKDLTARFGKGWHDGIQIDASDIADLCLAADALEQQAAQIEALRADAERLRASAEKVILFNRDHANDQYGDPNKAEAWACVRELRAALRQETKKGDLLET